MNREDAVEILDAMIEFGRHTSTEDQALTLAINVLNHPVKYLSSQERREAYLALEYEYDMEDIKNEIEFRFEYYDECFDIWTNPVTDEELGQMANEMRRLLDEDCERTWLYCAQCAIASVLSEREETEIV